MTTMAARYKEFVPPALIGIRETAGELGFAVLGILGDDSHTRGAHLSAARLLGTSHQLDYTLQTGPVDAHWYRAAAAIDLATGPVNAPPWAGEWLEDVRARCRSGAIDFLGELIGDPDMIPGPTRDGVRPLYASPGTGWGWVPYEGSGHDVWCHLWILRQRLGDTTLASTLFAGWRREGRVDRMPTPAEVQIERVVRDLQFAIPGHTYNRLGPILVAYGSLLDTLASPAYRQALIREVRDEVLAELRSGAPE